MADSLDHDLLAVLATHGFLDLARDESTSLTDAVLLVEAAERAYARAPIAARAIVGASLPVEVADSVALVEPERLVRYAGLCDTYLILDGDDVYRCDAHDVDIRRVPARWGYPLGYVTPVRQQSLGSDNARLLRRLWRIAMAAEMSGQMQAAMELTTRFVTDRHQF